MEKMVILEDLLKEDGYTVIRKELISESCLINLVKKHKTAKKIFREATTIVVLACEVGYQCVRTTFPAKKVIGTTKTFGVGNFSIKKGAILTSPFESTGLKQEPQGYTLPKLVANFNLFPKFFDYDKEPNPQKVNITVNGKPLEVKKDSNLLDALLLNRIRVPHLCYDSSLGSMASCRLCLVKAKGKRGLIPSCCIQVEEGMEITTEDEEITSLRKLTLEMIIAECGNTIQKSKDIRYWIRRYGIESTRFELSKKDETIDDSSEVLIRDPNRCILCGRCISACANISGQKVLNFANRGSKTITIAGLNESLANTDCAHCLACTHYCPVNAITPKSITKKVKAYPFWTLISYPKLFSKS